MEIKKTVNGYTIEVNPDEYQTFVDALYYAEKHWDSYGINVHDHGYRSLYDKLIRARERYLTDEEAKPVINCLCCKNCLPPIKRTNGKMCNLQACIFDPA